MNNNELTNKIKWEKIILKKLTFQDSFITIDAASKLISEMLDHYEYDADFIFSKHEKMLTGKDNG